MSFNELGSVRPKFTERIQREVYDAIDPSKPELALPGKTVLITGAGRGIGLDVVDSFSKAQAKTIILTGRSEASLIDAKAKFEKTYPKIQFIIATVDIGVPASVDALFSGLKGKVQQIDILVNNAGTLSEYGPKLGDSSEEIFWEDMAANARGPYLLARGLIRFNAPDFPVTFIAYATAVTEPYTNMTGYALSKMCPVKMVELLDLEYPNIRAFSFLPGIVPTDLLQEPFRPLALDKASLSAGLSVFLCSPKADFLSGRFLDARWDIEQVLERKEEIVKNNWLKLQIAGY